MYGAMAFLVSEVPLTIDETYFFHSLERCISIIYGDPGLTCRDIKITK